MRATRTLVAVLFFLSVWSLTRADVAFAICGNGILEGGEECDPGGGTFVNGNPSSASCSSGGLCFFALTCCKFNCQFVGSGPSCFDGNECTTDDTCDQVGNCLGGGFAGSGSNCSDGLFCTATDTCNGAGVCVGAGDPCAGGSECADLCNEVAENCLDTNGTPCTSDGNQCTTDACDGAGSCTHVNHSGPCDDGAFCNGTDSCAGGSCSAHAGDPCAGGGECADACNESTDTCFDAPGTACSADANACTDDACNGSGACAHPNNTAPCDDGLFCNGSDTCSGGSCSAHSGDPCAGGIECADVCNEAADSCLVANGTPCGDGSDDDCTDPDACNGAGACVPNNAAAGAPAPTLCNDTLECTSDQCNGAGGCQNPPLGAGTPCGDTTNDECRNPDVCNGAGACVANDEAPGTPCGDGGDDDCTDPDTCDGSGACSDNDAPAGTAAPTTCGDALECTLDQCNGTGGCQNPDLALGTPCGNGADTECTDPDTCNGAGACVSNDELAGTPAPSLCADSLECTLDHCNGAGGCAHTPLALGLPCGSPTVSLCSLADTCDGAGACSANDFADGTLCADGDLCTVGDVCQDGVCVSSPLVCADVDACTYDRCDPLTGLCVSTPEPDPTCREAGASAFSVINNANDKRDVLKWKWFKGDEILLEDFGDPVTTTQYDLCIYDTIAGLPTVATHMILPPSALWYPKKNSYRYKDKARATDGFSSVRLFAGTDTRSKMSLVAKGMAMPTPTPIDELHFFEVAPELTVQLSNSEGVCWSSRFDQAFRNTGVKFKTVRKVLVN